MEGAEQGRDGEQQQNKQASRQTIMLPVVWGRFNNVNARGVSGTRCGSSSNSLFSEMAVGSRVESCSNEGATVAPAPAASVAASKKYAVAVAAIALLLLCVCACVGQIPHPPSCRAVTVTEALCGVQSFDTMLPTLARPCRNNRPVAGAISAVTCHRYDMRRTDMELDSPVDIPGGVCVGRSGAAVGGGGLTISDTD